METRSDCCARYRRLAASQTRLPAVLACLCGSVEFCGPRFLISSRYLLPLTAAFLVLALIALAFRAKNRHGYGPLMLGVVAAAGILVGKFRWESSAALYFAVGLLVVASLWNAWPHRDQSQAQPVLDA